MAATGGTTLTTTMWVVDWIHRNTTNLWTTTEPAAPTSLTQLDVAMLLVTNLSDGCAAI